jgi:hypothetical protein
MKYEDFIKNKEHSSQDYGIQGKIELPDNMFDFQKYITEYAIKKGRCALFLDTGLGKTIIELAIAQNYVKYTNKPVLIITPLAVAYQFIKEAEKFRINDVQYSKDGSYANKIVICNYERLHKFNNNDFDCVILDESSILKNFDGKYKHQITMFMKKIKYRYLATATPSPNDYIELGTSSETLGLLGYMDMLSRFFKNNNKTIKSTAIAHTGDEWYLKAHAKQSFWVWVNSWSVSLRTPSDIGFSDELYKLPELIEQTTIVKNNKPISKYGITPIFNFAAETFQEIRTECRNTIEERCVEACKKANSHEISVYWVNLNDEASFIKQYDKTTKEIKGQMCIDEKEDILLAFASGNIKKLITKTSITAFGLNWQHCNHTIYFPTYSYEQYYQAIRRFWRFGQKNPVIVDLVLSDGQTKIMKALLVKKNKAIDMYNNLVINTNKIYKEKNNSFSNNIQKPNFI